MAVRMAACVVICMHGCMGCWLNACIAWVDGCTPGCMRSCLHARLHGLLPACIVAWADGCTHGCMRCYLHARLHGLLAECMHRMGCVARMSAGRAYAGKTAAVVGATELAGSDPVACAPRFRTSITQGHASAHTSCLQPALHRQTAACCCTRICNSSCSLVCA